jgi:hypothetical protein
VTGRGRRRPAAAAWAAVLVVGIVAALGAAPAAADPAVPDDATLEEWGAVIGEIVVRAGDIFNTSEPAEDRALYRVANRLHRVTRVNVVRSLLLFETGDPYSRRVLDESERLLRATRYLYDAQIRPVRYVNNRVDVEVITRDVWTLTAGIGLSRSGGTNETRLQLQDTNFLGTGRDVAIERRTNVDRTSQLLKYRDLNLGGSRTSLEAWAADNSDGSYWRLELERPFFALDADWAAGLFAMYDDRIDSRYELGEVTDRFTSRQRFLELYAGRSGGLVDGRVNRFTAGFTYDRSLFGYEPGLPDPVDFLSSPRDLVPSDRVLAYPWVGYELVVDRFLETHDLDQIERTEDLFLGHQLRLRLGWSSEAVGSDDDGAIYAAGFRTAFTPGKGTGRMLLFSGDLSGRWNEEGVENLLAGVGARWYQRDFGRHLFFATARFDLTRELDSDRQLLLGGDSGLRGYPLRYQQGDRRFLVTLEQRFYTDLHILRLLHVGGAVFCDVGRTWFSEPGREAEELGTLKDIGFGLRLASSRSGQGSMIHLDVAFPLDRDPSIDSVQWLVSTRETF